MLMMTFSADPYAGLNHQRFEGSAIVFLASAMSDGRTALAIILQFFSMPSASM